MHAFKLVWLIGVFLSLLCIGLWHQKKILNVGVCCFFLFLGLLNGCRPAPSAEEQIAPYFGKNITVYGVVDEASLKEHKDGYSFILHSEKIAVNGVAGNYHGGLRIFLTKKQLPKDVVPTGRMMVSGRLDRLNGFRNPGSFDSTLWNRVHNIGGSLHKAQLLALEPRTGIMDKAVQLNRSLRAKFAEHLEPEAAAMMTGMMLGGTDMAEETRELFVVNGMAHLLSVSGAHLVLLSTLLGFIFKPIAIKWHKPLILILLLCYGALCGFKPPIVRALCMSAVTLYGGSGGERGLLLGLTSIVLLLYEPLWLLDLGFQLSFVAVAGIIWLQPKCYQLLNKLLPEFIAELVAVTLAAQLAVLPLEIANFHQISVIAMVSNLLFVPVLELCVLLSSVGLVFSYLSLGECFFTATEFLVKQVVVQAEWLAQLPFSTIVIGSLTNDTYYDAYMASSFVEQSVLGKNDVTLQLMLFFQKAVELFFGTGIPLLYGTAYYVLVFVWADVGLAMYLSNFQRRCIISLCVAFLGGALLWSRYGPQPLTVYYLDVGQGDCAVVVTPNSLGIRRKIIVFDTGGLKNYSTGSRILAPFLRTLGVKEIDMLVLSHYDFDHVGGADGLARVCDCRQVLLPKETITSSSEGLLLNMAEQWRSCNFIMAEKGMEYCFTADGDIGSYHENILEQQKEAELGENIVNTLLDDKGYEQYGNKRYLRRNDVVLKIIDAPDKLVTGNEASTVAEISCNNYKLLFTGDLGEKREELMQNLTSYEVLKAGHHGSRYSSCDTFLNQVRPKITVISCGLNNRFGHPHQEALERFKFYGSKVLRTDESGCVKLVFDNEIRAYGYAEGKWKKCFSDIY